MIKFCVLGSGSKGNSVFVEIDGHGILLDAGFPFKTLKARLASINRSVKDVGMAFVSHQHKDHCQGLPGLQKTNSKITILTEFIHGQPIEFMKFSVTPFLLSHDEICYGFVIIDGVGNKLAYITDTGCIPENVYPFLFDCNAIILEFNHDIQMLVEGPYPSKLQERIFSDVGHMNNEDSGDVLRGVAWEGLKHVVCYHLSEQCNNSALAIYEAEAGLKEGGCKVGDGGCRVHCAEQGDVGNWVTLI